MYVCYDVKGIQSFIFSIPKLKYIIGASSLIDEWDKKVVKDLWPEKHVYSAGGKGAFRVANADEATSLKERLRKAAHERGLDIAFGTDVSFSKAANEAHEFRPYLPDLKSLSGHPCSASGLYPVAGGGRDVHPIVGKRIVDRGNGDARDRIEDALLQRLCKVDSGLMRLNPTFIRNVSPEADSDDDGQAERGSAALGNRNRWAVICMDGNDMGSQFRVFMAQTPSPNDDATTAWVRAMSKALDDCANQACVEAIAAVYKEWSASRTASDEPEKGLVLPVRPLVVGGDDIIVLCHVSHAMTFVKTACEVFERESKTRHENAKKQKATPKGLWLATGGRLTITAGVLFAPVNYPLSSAIELAEGLLASAKFKGREFLRKKQARTGNGGEDGPQEPSPACVDWESITDGLVETVAERRQRDWLFEDGDLKECKKVRLSKRPYLVEELKRLESNAKELEKIPNTLRHEIMNRLRAGFWSRAAFVAQLGKRHGKLTEFLREEPAPGNTRDPNGSEDHLRWSYDSGQGMRSTGIVDVLLLLEEQARMKKETAHG